ncbi:MAG: hypothetical protein K9L30_18945 [Desulfobacterales bacterium]|nr:hypothetical protein [Desulfobacterales bacterium]
MIYEYAIEPELLVEWAQNQIVASYINDNFGLGKPRLMSEFPKLKKIRKQYLEYTNQPENDDHAKKRLAELFSCLTEKTIKRQNYYYDGQKSWLENAELEDAQKMPFRAIISQKNPRQKSKILLNEAIGGWPAKYWDADDSIRVKKQAQSIIELITPLLYSCNKIYWIDPYFRLQKNISLFRLILKTLLSHNKDLSKQTFEIHFSIDNLGATQKHIEKQFRKKIEPILPEKLVLNIKGWSRLPGKEKYHDRFLLTDIGGIRSSFGFDEEYGEVTTALDLLSKKEYLSRMQNYIHSPVFELEYQFCMTGITINQTKN